MFKPASTDGFFDRADVGSSYPPYRPTKWASVQPGHGSAVGVCCGNVNYARLCQQAPLQSSVLAGADSYVGDRAVKWIDSILATANYPCIQSFLRRLYELIERGR